MNEPVAHFDFDVIRYRFCSPCLRIFRLYLKEAVKMVRNYKKKRETELNEEDVTKAVREVLNGTMKLRQAAGVYNIRPNTLHYRIKKLKVGSKLKSVNFTTKYTVSQVFTKDEEKMLKEYAITRSKMHYGLTYKNFRLLALEYATALGKCPEKWTANKEAGVEWLKGFMKRHKDLSLRKPENTSLSRSTSFNKHNVMKFYDNYEHVLKKYKFTPDRIFNLDETNIMTVVQAPNVIARTGTKQVGQSVSAERGQLVTMCGIGNAIGNCLPPVFVFPRARFHESMLNGGPIGCVGFANSPTSGWMTGPLFIKVLEHIKKLVRCSKDDPILILMDNHESHCTIDVVNYCRDNGMVVVTFPPHCTHRMQPLDVAVNGPFKQKLAVSQNDWLVNHPGKTITIHDLAGIMTPAYNSAYTAVNMAAGFAKPGIYPFSRNAFTDDDFECAEVTNRPIPTTPLVAADEQLDSTGSAQLEAVLGTNRPTTTPSTVVADEHQDQAESAQSANLPVVTTNCPIATTSTLTTSSEHQCSSKSAQLEPTQLVTATNSHVPTISGAVCGDNAQDSFEFSHQDSSEHSPVIAAFELISKLASIPSISVPRLQTDRLPVTPESTALHDEIEQSVFDIHFENDISTTGEGFAVVTPELVWPLPKALPRKESNKGRKKGKSRILTDTPEKEEILKAYLDRQSRLKKTESKAAKQKITKNAKRVNSKPNQKRLKVSKPKSSRRKPAKTTLSFSSDETDTEMILESEEEGVYSSGEDENTHDCINADSKGPSSSISIKSGDYVLARFTSQNHKRNLAFVGLVVDLQRNNFIVSFMRKKGGSYKFYFPEKEDKCYVTSSDILVKLPPPIESTGTSRTAAMKAFKFNFSKFQLG